MSPGSTFKGNTASGKGGGAIAFLSDSVVAKEGTTVISGSTFEENKSLGTKDQQGGGALRIEGTAVEVTGDSSFIGNTSALNGGASYVHAVESSLTVDGATFEKTLLVKMAELLSFSVTEKTDNDQKLVVSNAKFTGNSAVKKGGAIAWLQMEKNQTREQNLVINIATFSGNEAETGGAISAEDTLTISGASSFNGNKATLQGGAISILGTGTLGGELVISEGTEESHVIFSNNEVTGTNSSSKVVRFIIQDRSILATIRSSPAIAPRSAVQFPTRALKITSSATTFPLMEIQQNGLAPSSNQRSNLKMATMSALSTTRPPAPLLESQLMIMAMPAWAAPFRIKAQANPR